MSCLRDGALVIFRQFYRSVHLTLHWLKCIALLASPAAVGRKAECDASIRKRPNNASLAASLVTIKLLFDSFVEIPFTNPLQPPSLRPFLPCHAPSQAATSSSTTTRRVASPSPLPSLTAFSATQQVLTPFAPSLSRLEFITCSCVILSGIALVASSGTMTFITNPIPLRSAHNNTLRTTTPSHPASPYSIAPNMNLASATIYKDALLAKLKPLNYGRAVATDPRAQQEIEDLVRQVESAAKSQSPGTDPNLSGAWKMVYTTSKDILSVGKPAFLQGVDIVQGIDAQTLTGYNSESLQLGPFKISNAVNFKLSPTSEKRFNVNFVKFIIGGLIKIDVEANDRFTGWLEVTYLDEDLRISRGNKGNLFVLVK